MPFRGLLTTKRRSRDSNPGITSRRSHTFQACAFNHSATSPKQYHYYKLKKRFKPSQGIEECARFHNYFRKAGQPLGHLSKVNYVIKKNAPGLDTT